MVKKILFLSTFLFITSLLNVNAQTYNLSFNSFLDTAENLSSNIQCNNSQCIVYNVPFYNYRMDFEWGTTNSPTCSSTAIVSGILYNDNSSFGVNNNDFNWSRVYIVPSGSGQSYNCSFSVSENGTSYVCTSPTLSSNFKIGFTLDNNFGGQVSFNSVINRSVDVNCDTSTGQIIDNQNNNTQNIINNNTQNSQNIINNQNSNTNQIIQDNQQNTQDIIDNQNSNTEKEIESQKVCSNFTIDNSFSFSTTSHYLTSTGSFYSDDSWSVTDYLPVTSIEKTKTIGNAPSICFYKKDKTLISCSTNSSTPIGNVSIPVDTYYARFSINIRFNSPIYNIVSCVDGNQALNDTLTSDTPPDTENQLNDLDSSLISDTPITDLITLPITLLNSYISGFSGSCSPYNFGSLFGTDIIFPCINLEQILGSNLWTIIDALFSIYMIYNIAMLMIQAFEGFTSLRDDYEALYQPRHADTGYQPKHGGGS